MENDEYFIRDYFLFIDKDGDDYEQMLDSMGDYEDDYTDLHQSESYEDYIFSSECIIDSLVDGTFDFDSDTLHSLH